MVTVMPLDEFIINVFCLVDDFYITQLQKPLPQRGTAPKLSDSEVMGWFAPPNRLQRAILVSTSKTATERTPMSISVLGIDIGKNSFHLFDNSASGLK